MILAAIALVAAPPADGWRTYSNPRFAFSICYPASIFRPGRAPDNGDGLVFAARDGATFTASGINDALDEGLSRRQASEERDAPGKITYRAKGDDWFVISGRSASRIFYTKTFFRSGQFLSLHLSYPTSSAARYAPVVTRMQRCFKYGAPPF